jgi:predicted nucleic acid-binding Zn ribbon protein
MDPIIFVLLAAVLIGAAFYLVALPLLQHARRSDAPSLEYSTEQERLDELLAQRAAAFQALRELNFDHKVGKITDEDFVAFEANLKQHAANTLRALDAWEAQADDDLDLEMEAEIEARRAALADRTNGHDAGAPCPVCGKPAAVDDRFCAGCGADLTAAHVVAPAPAPDALACPACGVAYHPGDRFCGSCGQPLAAPAASAR